MPRDATGYLKGSAWLSTPPLGVDFVTPSPLGQRSEALRDPSRFFLKADRRRAEETATEDREGEIVDERIMSEVEWEAELQQAMREIRRGEYRRRKALSQRDASPWVV